MPELEIYASAEGFLADAGEALYQEEALNSLILGIAERLERDHLYYGSAPFLSTVYEGGELVLAAVMTPPHGLLLSPMAVDVEEAMVLVLDVLLAQEWPLPDVNGQQPYPEQFARLWVARTGGRYALDMAQRLYVLHTVTAPENVPGELVVAGEAHADLITQWFRNFELDCFGTSRPLDKIRHAVERLLDGENWHLWLVAGEPVSMCLRTRPIRNTCAVSGVYTPPELRRNGYASACVAALSQKLLDDGFAYTTLYTDLANPTSNSVYTQIGYEPAADFDKYLLKRE